MIEKQKEIIEKLFHIMEEFDKNKNIIITFDNITYDMDYYFPLLIGCEPPQWYCNCILSRDNKSAGVLVNLADHVEKKRDILFPTRIYTMFYIAYGMYLNTVFPAGELDDENFAKFKKFCESTYSHFNEEQKAYLSYTSAVSLGDIRLAKEIFTDEELKYIEEKAFPLCEELAKIYLN